ncbi:hypothetical protein [Streptomyces xantholiticus]|uniref:hypothetical protein n=1 Tax=Streptomyces xantholiticus TaxID=68285 RepID=UPI00167A3392|nr:hypothetical protein [Streptomyces xantholiticus]GGW67330.1 hypothetical protein GCM10010381_60330 [Streptomyces xantholiticus]
MKKLMSSAAALVAVTAGLLVPGTSAQAAALPDYYIVEVTFDAFSSTFDDCEFFEGCSRAEVYGTLSAGSQAPGATSVRLNRALNLAAWREEDRDCSYNGTDWSMAPWNSNNQDLASCPRGVYSGTQYKFSDTFLCASGTYKSCDSSHPRIKNNNKVQVAVYAGDQLKISYKFMDKDSSSRDDVLCEGNLFIGNLTHSTLPGLSLSDQSSSSGESNSSCTVHYRLETVGAVI